MGLESSSQGWGWTVEAFSPAAPELSVEEELQGGLTESRMLTVTDGEWSLQGQSSRIMAPGESYGSTSAASDRFAPVFPAPSTGQEVCKIAEKA